MPTPQSCMKQFDVLVHLFDEASTFSSELAVEEIDDKALSIG